MTCLKIKQLDHRIGCAGIHLGGDVRRRKLEPGEIVEIPDDLMANAQEKMFDVLYRTGRVEITMDAPNRPLDFLSEREATLTSSNFKSRGPHEDLEREQALAAVSARMAESNSVSVQADSPAEITQSPTPEPEQAKPPTARNRRAQRRATAAGANTGAGVPQNA